MHDLCKVADKISWVQRKLADQTIRLVTMMPTGIDPQCNAHSRKCQALLIARQFKFLAEDRREAESRHLPKPNAGEIESDT